MDFFQLMFLENGITLENKAEGFSLLNSVTPPNDVVFKTSRLLACNPTKGRISRMADILNEDNGGKLNGEFYEDGQPKGLDWILHKYDLIFEKKITTCAFFYSAENTNEIACIVGRESDFKTTTTQRLFYLTSVKYQKKGLTTEAIRGFLKADDLNYDTLELSINPYNNSSIAIAKAIGALKVAEGYNSAGNQLRHFYAISTIKLLDKYLL
jgi:RimJ/RimL family protein N-acetyltransferase